MKLQVYFFSFFLCICAANAARILAIMPIKAKSHFYFHEALFASLVSSGHHVTLINPFSLRKPIHNFTIIKPPVQEAEDTSPLTLVASLEVNIFAKYELVTDMAAKDCENVMRMPFIQNLLKSREKLFDVIFVELFYMYECYFPIAEKLGVPVIGTFSSLTLSTVDYATGNPNNPSVKPFELSPFGMKMTFYERLLNLCHHTLDYYMVNFMTQAKVRKFYEKYYPNSNLVRDTKVSLIFLNDHPSYVPKPMVPSIIHVAGLHLEGYTNKEPPNEFRKFIDGAHHGVILFSLGSIVSAGALSLELRSALRETFAQIPQRIIWKFDEKIPGLSDNVMVSNWVPQYEILAHPNVIAFITHCGQLSTYEAIYYGKPLIMMPIYADQPSNAGRLEEIGVGIRLNILDTSKEDLLHSINEIVNNTKYRENMRILSEAMKDVPISPSELVVYWTNYVLRHDGALHLRTTGADMPLYQYLLLDVIGFVAAVIIVSIYILIYLCRRTCRYLTQQKSKTDISAKKKR